MTPTGRIAAFVLLTAAAAGATLWATRESLRPRENAQEVGLSWLKDEYHLDDVTFEKVSALHRDYFRQCDRMCRQINEADRPLLWHARHRNRQPGELDAQITRDQIVSGDCEKAATERLKQVAAIPRPSPNLKTSASCKWPAPTPHQMSRPQPMNASLPCKKLSANFHTICVKS